MALWKPIPGETPIDEAGGLKVKGINRRSELNAIEAANIMEVTEKYLVGQPTIRNARFDLTWAFRLHKEMFGKVWRWAGTRRTDQTNLGVAPHQIEAKVYDLLQNLPFWKNEPWLTQAMRLHHQAVVIHPFPNGNGRRSRMLANIWLRLNKQPFTMWPEELVGTESVLRQEYLAAIKAGDDGDYDLLLELHRRFTSDP